MIFLSLIGCIAIFLFSKPKQNVLIDPMTLFFVGLLYYGFFIPICMIMFNNYYLPALDDGVYVTNYELNVVAITLFLGYLAFVIGYRIFTPKNFIDDVVTRAQSEEAKLWDMGGLMIAAIAAASILICVVFFWPQLSAVLSGYEGKILTRYEFSTFTLIYNLSLVFATILLARKILVSRTYARFSILSILVLFSLSLLTFSKEPMVLAAITMLAAGARFSAKRQTTILAAGVVGAVLLLVFFVPAFSAYRATGELSLTSIQHMPLYLIFSDARGPFSTFILAISDGVSIHLRPLYESFLLWIPRGVWPGRPLDAAEEFARAVMADWRPGYGLGFSPFAEGVVRFGFFSPVLFFLSGLIISFMQRWLAGRIPPTLVPAVLLVVHGYLMFTFHRLPFSGIFTSLSQFWVPFLIASIVVGLMLKLGRGSDKLVVRDV